MELGYRHPMGPLKLTDLVGPRRAPRHPRSPAPGARRAVPRPAAAPADGARRQAREEDAARGSTSGRTASRSRSARARLRSRMNASRAAFVVDAVRTPIAPLQGRPRHGPRPTTSRRTCSRALATRSPAARRAARPGRLRRDQPGGRGQPQRRAHGGAPRGAARTRCRRVTVNRLCGSGLEAVADAVRRVVDGRRRRGRRGRRREHDARAVRVRQDRRGLRRARRRRCSTRRSAGASRTRAMAARFPLLSMGETAENVATKWSIAREEQDAFALASQKKAAAAIARGRVRPGDRAGARRRRRRASRCSSRRTSRPARDVTLEALAKLAARVPQGRHGHRRATARRSTTARAAVLVASEEVVRAREARAARARRGARDGRRRTRA